tara:strand:- start:133 stop:450 length:318 start_codon:yes stop_codon:yes gene_type:complete
MSEEKNFVKNTEKEVSAWIIAGRTAPFVAMAGMLVTAIFADAWLTVYAFTVVIIWVLVSVAWWWWALSKILKVIKMMLSTKIKFDEVKEELKSIKNDMGNRKRRE